MTVSDPIADMLTRIRNAGKAKFSSVDVPASNMKIEIAKAMKNEGYIKNFKLIKDGKQGILRIWLKFDANNESVIYTLDRVSKPSRRVYIKAKDIRPFRNGLGVALLSTPKGILTDKSAKTENLGGEVLCRIW